MRKEKEIYLSSLNSINYIFFGFCFFIVAFIHIFHIFLIEPSTSLSTYFFAVYALVQTLVEILAMVLVSRFIKNYFPRLMNVYIVFIFFIFLSHLIDFPLVRIMDMSFWYALQFLSQQSYENSVELLSAANISLLVWVMAGLGCFGVLLSGIFFYRIAQRWTDRHPLYISLPVLMGALASAVVFLGGFDLGVKPYISTLYFDRFEKTLPWKRVFFSPHFNYLSLENGLEEPLGGEELFRKLDSQIFSLTHKPDIYLFVIESLREDYITEENTPHLRAFKKQNVSFEQAFSNSNATQISWFSLFYSQFPFHWGKYDPKEKKEGSPCLQLLKKMGYKVYVSSSARLSFYHMNQIIFGEGEYLADHIFYPDEQEPYLRDVSTMQHVKEMMLKEGSGRVFITFLDATHFDYSWPKEATRFVPYEEKINHIKAAISKKGLNEIINRYRNSLYFVDSEFGEFLQTLEKAPGGKEAIVVVTGDHGEEFYEQGNLFHASNLSHPQINPPLYYKFGQSGSMRSQVSCSMSCHMDIFPTLFHYLLGDDLMVDLLQGQSIFKKQRWPYTVIARFSFNQIPYEYCIHNGKDKLITGFSEARDISSDRTLKILSTKNCRDENLPKELDTIYEEFGPALNHLFPSILK